MRIVFLAAVAAGTLAAGASSAAQLDFLAFANGNEHGVANGTTISFDGVGVTFNAGLHNSTDPDVAFAYFDSQNAGLGVCKEGTFGGGQTNAGGGNKCASGAGDDNVTITETVTMTLDGTYNLSDLLFTGEYHNGTAVSDIEYLHLETTQAIANSNGPNGMDPRADNTLLFGTNGGALARYTFGDLATQTFNDVMSFTVAFDDFNVLNDNIDSKADQFYLASAVVNPVPVPAALPMLLAGLGGLGFMRRRQRKAA